MNPLLSAFLGALVRWALQGAAGIMVARGVLKGSEVEVYVGALALGLPSLLWSLWQKYGARVLFQMGRKLPSWLTEMDIHAVMAQNTPVENRTLAAVPMTATMGDTPPDPPKAPPKKGRHV